MNAVQRVEAEFVEQGRLQIAGNAGRVVLAARAGIGHTEGRRAARFAEAVVVQAVAEEGLVAVAEALVEAGGELIGVDRGGGVEGDDCRRHGGRGQVLVEIGGLRGQAVGGNPVAREGLASAARRGLRIVNGVGERAEIAVEHRLRGTGAVDGVALPLAHAFVIGEEEGAVAAVIDFRKHDGSAGRNAELVALQQVPLGCAKKLRESSFSLRRNS